MIDLSDDLARLLQAWRTSVPCSHPPENEFKVEGLQTSPLADESHCAALDVRFSNLATGSTLSATRLGEALRLMALVAAGHVEPAVWNALWTMDGLCPKDVAVCSRCDGRELGQPVILHIQACGKNKRKTAVAVLYEALYEWDEGAASTEFRELHDALASSVRTQPPARVLIQLRLFERHTESIPMVSRDLEKLLASASADKRPSPFEVTALHLSIFEYSPSTSEGREIFETAFASGLPVGLGRATLFLVKPETWDTVLNAVDLKLSELSVMEFPDADDRIFKLATFLGTRTHHLQSLNILWSLKSFGSDHTKRIHAVEAISAALFASSSCLRLGSLTLNLKDVTGEDMDAIERGAGAVRHPGGTARCESVKWFINSVPDDCIPRFVRLLGAVGATQLRVHVFDRRLSCHTLKSIISSSPMMSKLSLSTVNCEDFYELEDPAWLNCVSELRDFELRVTDGGGAKSLRALDALLTRIGVGLIRLRLVTYETHDCSFNGETLSPLNAAVADVVATRCRNLRELVVEAADATFYETLAHYLDQNTLRIEKLIVRDTNEHDDVPWVSVVEALRDQSHGASRYVKTLELGTPFISCRNRCVDSLIGMLSVNTTLQRMVLTTNHPHEFRDRFEALPHQLLSRVPSTGRQLALIDAVSKAQLPRLPADVLLNIFEFAGRARRRYILEAKAPH